MRTRLVLGLLVGLLPVLAACAPAPRTASGAPAQGNTQVMVLATIHGAHRDHPSYGYEDVGSIVREFEPDVVAVEMRAEDLGADEAYLAANYPPEMRAVAKAYRDRAEGIDWLGTELEGKPVPSDWWRAQSPIKALERDLQKDPAVRTPKADALQEEQMRIVRTASAAALNDGRYDTLARRYYDTLEEELAGTRYELLTSFYRARDQRIATNAASLVAANPGRRIMILVGADHRGPVVDALGQRFGTEIRLVPVP